MKISSKGRYALRLMIDLAERKDEGWITLKDISNRQGISIKYLEQIVNVLSKSGLLQSSRGPQGGYKLAHEPDSYKVGDILRSIEGKLAPVACLENEPNQCCRSEFCTTLHFWEGLYSCVNEYVDSFSLADLTK